MLFFSYQLLRACGVVLPWPWRPVITFIRREITLNQNRNQGAQKERTWFDFYYLPENSALRFSKKADVPSFLSSEAQQIPKALTS